MAYRFDESFLKDRELKQRKWKANGVKTGSGKDFNDEIKIISGNGGLPLPHQQKSHNKINKNSKKKIVSDSGISVHAIALAKLAKNPKLRSGGLVNGKRKSANHEHYEQVILFDWLYRYHKEIYDDFSAIPNGGLRDNKTASSLLEEGAKAGYPDIVCDLACGGYHGLFIELKYNKNKPSTYQIAMLNRKMSRGYFCAVCYGASEAQEVIEEYINLTHKNKMIWTKNNSLWLVDHEQNDC